ncbi:hypothetical protein [Terrarubrum flagellatum]|uniref:hypothetical protein n=1 Tax=Terrirubrum flagellatum TaxID=2895980 RepID=UPI0031453457
MTAASASRLAVIAGAGLLAAASLASPARAQAQGDTVIEGSYYTVSDRLRPDPASGLRSLQRFRIVLSGANQISETWRASNAFGFGGSTTQRTRVLGGSAEEGGSRWQVAASNKLVRTVNHPQSTTFITVTTVSNKTCRVDVDYRLKPGFSEFKFRRRVDRKWAYFANTHAESPSCWIQ